MSEFDPQRSITDLIGGLASDISGLFRKEIQLAKAEVSEKVDDMVVASKGLAVGGILAIGAVGVLLAAAVAALTVVLIWIGISAEIANVIAPLVVGIVVALIAWSMISGSLAAWKANRLNLDRTTQSLARDAEVVKESF